MGLKLVLVEGPGPAAAGMGGAPALAWTDNAGTIYCRRPFHRILFAHARIAHEVEHNTAPDFKSNENHHPWWHLCGRAGHAARILGRLHLAPASWNTAEELRART